MDFDGLAEWAELLRIVAHPARLAILGAVVQGPRCVNDIQELLAVRQSNVSQHLTVLRHNGLIAFHQDGGRRCYYLTRPALVRALFELIEGSYPTVKLTREEVVEAAKASRSKAAAHKARR